MLRVIRIRNLALIRDLQIEFDRGLNLLTGETGSGKSILVDALGLLLGARSSQEMIRTDCDTAVLEGMFEIESRGSASRLIEEAGFENEDNTLLIRREISVSGRNRIFVNNRMATLSLLKSLGERLADIHGQQDQRSLLDLSTHREWLDYYGNNESLLGEVREIYRKLRATSQQIESLESSEQERLRRIDMLRYQIDEIRGINPGPDEKEELETERNILTNREKILAASTEAYGILYEGEASILSRMNRLERILEELSTFDRGWGAHQEALQDCKYKLQDLSYMARDYAARSDFSPDRLDQVHQRLHALEKLTKKYGASCREILGFLDKCQSELQEILAYTERSECLSRQFDAEAEAYRRCAEKLSAKRRQDAVRLESEIGREFKALAMERMKLHVRFGTQEEGQDQTRFPASYGLHGMDRVEFLLAPNKGEEMRPLAKIASGGELSRLMLSIRSLCRNEESDKTFVFDEVDAGIGGRVAEAVGRRLRSIAEENQVLCVTHLPQIAAFARCHFSVRKEVVDGRTETIVKTLSDTERIQELSRMLGGETITRTARDHAQEMLEFAAKDGKKQ